MHRAIESFTSTTRELIMHNQTSEDRQAPGGMSRRSVLKWGAALAGVTAASGTGLFYGLKAANGTPEKNEKILWTSCNVNCGGRCLLRAHVQDGVVTRIETDNCEDIYGRHQIRACLRGRSMRRRMYAPERLKYPMKRVGKRGEGNFERVSWDQAFDEISARLKATLEKYGNESVYLNYATGNLGAVLSKSWPPGATPVARLMNCMGGYLNHYGDYSTAQISRALPFTFGGGWVSGNPFSDIVNSELVILFGNNPAETRMGGGGSIYDLVQNRGKSKPRIIVIDPRYTDTAVQAADEWIPIRPGTDAALVSAIAHVLITEDLVDHDFISRCTVGFDEDSMPEGIPAGNSYKSYILGQGPDKIAKTPAWGAKITGIPERSIIQLAREIGNAKPCYIAQGWSSQRQANGEQNSRAICMLPILTGNVGVQGGNTGAREGDYGIPFPGFPTLENPVKASISCFSWTEAIERGREMTAVADGVQGRDKLIADIKFIWNYAGNCLVNQHADSNRTSEILADDSKCETIVVIDNFMTPSAKFADYLLPANFNLEEDDFARWGKAADMGYVILAQKVVEPFYESRSIYDICAGVAKRMGVEKDFTEGRTRDEWVRHLYAQAREMYPELPERLEDAWKLGALKKKAEGLPRVPYKAFHDDPENNPLGTPSGKLEIFSKSLWDISREWTLPEGSRITALPQYDPAWEGVSDPLREKYPLQMIGHHYKQRTHSTYGNVDWLKQVAPQELWMNPLDAEARGIKHGDMVKVYNDRGIVHVPVKVTPRIMPGVLSLPQGAWFTPDGKGIDKGGCVNVLTTLRPSPLAKGNPQHTNLVQVAKL